MIRMTPLSNLLRQSPWRLKLLHSSPLDRVIWLTHGQGRVLMEGRRMGTGIHNFLVIPAGTVFVIDPSPQTNGVLVEATPHLSPHMPASGQLLRIRDVGPQGEIAGHLERMQNEQLLNRAFKEDALRAPTSATIGRDNVCVVPKTHKMGGASGKSDRCFG